MRLSRQKVFLLVLVSGIACSDGTGPATVSAFFMLQTIDGRALPTYIAATPGPTTTIISSSLILDKTGKAVVIEHRNEMLRGDVTDTTTYEYQIQGIQIVMSEPILCTSSSICPALRTGTISPLGLSLVINPNSTDSHIVYQYRGIGLD
jgi:hypothetical protein